MQQAPQSVGMAPPKPSITPDAAYAYDIDYRNGVCAATILVTPVTGDPVWPLATPPVSGIACAVRSAAGGSISGFDMYGQFCAETLTAGVNSEYTYARILSGPADLVWRTTFGLPYKWASGGNTDADYTWAGPSASGDPRGTVTIANLTADVFTEAKLDYVVDMTQLYGEPLADRFATADRIADTATTATFNLGDGTVVVTVAAVADSSETIVFTMPDGAPIRVANEAGTINYTVPALWLSMYGSATLNGENTEIIRGVTSSGTNVIVTTTVSNGVDQQDTGTIVYGPFSAGGDDTEFWTNSNCKVGFDIDDEPEPDVWFTWQEVMDNDDVSTSTKDAISAQLRLQRCIV